MLVVFGIGNIAKKTIQKYKVTPDICVDNSEAVWNTTWNDIKVVSPQELQDKEIDKIIICTTSYDSVKKQLVDMGFDMKTIEVSSVLDSIVVSDRIESTFFDLLFVSGIPSHSSDLEGGGVYRLTGNFKDYSLSKIYSGNCHSIVQHKEFGISVTDSNKGLVLLDKNLNVTKIITLPSLSKLRPHGCSIVDKESFLLACSYDDSIVHCNTDGKTIRRYGLSNAIDRFNIPQHHINDISYHDGYIYASMFSVTGAWQSGFLDGGIVRIDMNSGEQAVVLDGMSMPHNIQVSDDGYLVCNSYQGTLLGNNKSVKFQGNGFLRGLHNANDCWIVAESKNRNFANIEGGTKNSCLDSRINFVDKKSLAYRSIQLPYGVTEIHSIISIL
jgi:hypothetical protein